MPCDKDFGYLTLTRGLNWERYGDLWQLTYVNMSKTTSKDHLIILREFLAVNKILAMNSSIQAWVNCSRVRVNCSHASVKLHLSCTVPSLLYCCIWMELNLIWLTKSYVAWFHWTKVSSLLQIQTQLGVMGWRFINIGIIQPSKEPVYSQDVTVG